MIINTNLSSLRAHRLGKNNLSSLNDSLRKLSTGLRIASAADDAAGLAISEKMLTQVKGLNRASMNAQDGINMFQTAEGALIEVNSMLQRMRELSIQAANGIYTADDRIEIQKEITQLKDEIDRIAQTTEFNTKKLLDGSASGIWSTDSNDIIEAAIVGKVREGNYNLKINISAPATNQVWQSDVLTLKDSAARTLTADRTEFAITNNSGNTNSRALVSLTGTLTSDFYGSFEFLQGKAAEVIASSALTLSSREVGGVTFARAAGSVAAVTADVIKFTADSTITVNDTDNTVSFTFSAGSTWTQTEIEEVLENTMSAVDSVTWVASSSGNGDHMRLTLDGADSAVITFNSGASTAFGVTLGSTSVTTGSFIQGTAVTEAANVFQFDAAAGGITASTTITFTITGTAAATITFNLGKGTSATTNSSLETLTSFSFSEEYVLDQFNDALNLGNTGVRAEIDSNHYLNLVTTTADGTVRPTRIQVTGSYNNAPADALITDIGLSDGTFFESGDSKIVFTVNEPISSTTTNVYTAYLTAKTYSSNDSLAAEIERAMNAAIGSSNSENYVSAFVDDEDKLHIMSRKTGQNSEINLLYGAQTGSALPDLGIVLNDHAQGNNDGVSLAFYNRDTGELATHIYNRRAERTAAATWTAGATNITGFSFSADATITISEAGGDAVTLSIEKGTVMSKEALAAKINNAMADYNISGAATVNGNGVQLANSVNGAAETITFTFNTAGQNIMGFADTVEITEGGAAVTSNKTESTENSGMVLTNDFNLGSDLEFTYYSSLATVGDKGDFTIDYTQSGQKDYIAKATDTLSTISKFVDADGNNILDRAKVLTIMGNDAEANITIDRGDTLHTLQQKIQEAITKDKIDGGLGMSTGTTAIDAHVADYVGSTAESTLKTATGNAAVKGTIVVRSSFPGKYGKISFAGDENLLKALSFLEIQEPGSDNNIGYYNIDITDAHTGESIGTQRIADPVMKEGIDGVWVSIKPTVDLGIEWNELTGNFDFSAKADSENVKLHVVDTSVDIHIGPNENQLLNATITQMDTKALEIENLSVVNVDDAQEAISALDEAIITVASERSKMGSYINRLNHTILNLGVSAENLKATESSIRDLDMAQEMIDFTKFQILTNTTTSLLAQANSLPQNVLQLIRG